MHKPIRKTPGAQAKEIQQIWEELGENPKVKAIIFSARSSDALVYFTMFLSRLPDKELQKLLSQGDLVKYLLKNYEKYFKPYRVHTNKDYTFKRPSNDRATDKFVVLDLEPTGWNMRFNSGYFDGTPAQFTRRFGEPFVEPPPANAFYGENEDSPYKGNRTTLTWWFEHTSGKRVMLFDQRGDEEAMLEDPPTPNSTQKLDFMVNAESKKVGELFMEYLRTSS